MKKLTCILLSALMLMSMSACGGDTQTDAQDQPQDQMQTGVPEVTQTPAAGSDESGSGDVDVDLTALSSTVVYAEVYNMLVSPDDYRGKTVKMSGQFALYEDPDTGVRYYACIIADATACCSQGLEFALAGEYIYPDDYPELGTEITVTGTFGTYDENGSEYCQLSDAVMSC